LSDYGYSLKPKHVANNKSDTNIVVFDGRASLTLFTYHKGMPLINIRLVSSHNLIPLSVRQVLNF